VYETSCLRFKIKPTFVLNITFLCLSNAEPRIPYTSYANKHNFDDHYQGARREKVKPEEDVVSENAKHIVLSLPINCSKEA
jgi:hypothetical protein